MEGQTSELAWLARLAGRRRCAASVVSAIALVLAAVLGLPSLLAAAERVDQPKVDAENVEMFAAMEAGQL